MDLVDQTPPETPEPDDIRQKWREKLEAIGTQALDRAEKATHSGDDGVYTAAGTNSAQADLTVFADVLSLLGKLRQAPSEELGQTVAEAVADEVSNVVSDTLRRGTVWDDLVDELVADARKKLAEPKAEG